MSIRTGLTWTIGAFVVLILMVIAIGYRRGICSIRWHPRARLLEAIRQIKQVSNAVPGVNRRCSQNTDSAAFTCISAT
jgi:hypothetical protein